MDEDATTQTSDAQGDRADSPRRGDVLRVPPTEIRDTGTYRGLSVQFEIKVATEAEEKGLAAAQASAIRNVLLHLARQSEDAHPGTREENFDSSRPQ